MNLEAPRGVDPAELGDEDLMRELGHLYETRMDALRHAADQALDEHTHRMAQLETESGADVRGRAGEEPAGTVAELNAG
jgi:hypothetical protein